MIDSSIMQLLPVAFAKEMISILMGGEPEPAPEPELTSAARQADQAPQPGHQEPSYQQQISTQPTAPPQTYPEPTAYQQPAYPQPQASMGNINANRNVNVQSVQFSNLPGGPAAHGDETNLNLLLDIPLKVTVELGRTQKVIKDILELSQGSIIELDKLAGEPVDILVNNKLIAKGEVVVIDENFGVRVTDIVNQWDRIHKLQ